MRGFERRDDSLDGRQFLESIQCLVIRGVGVVNAPGILQESVLRSDGSVVQPC